MTTYSVYKDLCKGQGDAEYNTSKNIPEPDLTGRSQALWHCQNVCQIFQSSMFMCTMNLTLPVKVFF